MEVEIMTEPLSMIHILIKIKLLIQKIDKNNVFLIILTYDYY